AEIEMHDLVLARRAGAPVRKVVHELRAGGIDLEPEMGLDHVHAAHAHFASPERIDAARDHDFLHRCEIRIDGAGRIRNAQVAQDDFLRTAADDFDGTDRHDAAEAVLQRLLDAESYEAGETR